MLTPTLTPPSYSWRTSVTPAFPAGNLSLMHAINAMGNKFALPDLATTGPGSATNIATGLYTGEASFYFGSLPATGSDRDGNSLVDAWELHYFNAPGQNPTADVDGDGLKLMLENAFDLSPLVPDADSARLPRWTAGTAAPVALTYRVPVAQLEHFKFVPGLSENLDEWFWADTSPGYFLINATPDGLDNIYTVEPNLASWPGNTNHLFLRLQIKGGN